MTTLVLGHLVLDEIHSHDGRVYSSPGGITFPLKTFGALAGSDDTVLPVFPFGPDAAEVVSGFSEAHHAIDTSHCWDVEQGTTRVRLFHESSSEYNTQLVCSLAPIGPERFVGLLPKARLVYLNLMTGDDILPRTAAWLRGEGRLVYIDLHMIAYRVMRDGQRQPAPSEKWMEWMDAADVLQCNEQEFDALTGDESSVQSRMRDVFEQVEPAAFVLTKGERGADIYTAADHCLHVPAVISSDVVDPTGCGDAFGSTLAWGLARGDALETAAQRAAHAASFIVSLPGSEGIEGLREYLAGEGV